MSLGQIIAQGKSYSDGHFTIMHFTTNYRASFSTPNSREDIENMAIGKTAEEAIMKAFEKVKPIELVDILEKFRDSVVAHLNYVEEQLLKRTPEVDTDEDGDVLAFQSVRENCQDFYKENIWPIDKLIKHCKGKK